MKNKIIKYFCPYYNMVFPQKSFINWFSLNWTELTLEFLLMSLLHFLLIHHILFHNFPIKKFSFILFRWLHNTQFDAHPRDLAVSYWMLMKHLLICTFIINKRADKNSQQDCTVFCTEKEKNILKVKKIAKNTSNYCDNCTMY